MLLYITIIADAIVDADDAAAGGNQVGIELHLSSPPPGIVAR
jgi:hypothetical protein